MSSFQCHWRGHWGSGTCAGFAEVNIGGYFEPRSESGQSRSLPAAYKRHHHKSAAWIEEKTAEVEAEELAHVEADTFWLLEAMVAEFSGLEDDEGTVWMKKLSNRLAWVDFDFKAHLVSAHICCPSSLCN